MFVGELQVWDTWLEELLLHHVWHLLFHLPVLELCWDSLQSCIFADVVGYMLAE